MSLRDRLKGKHLFKLMGVTLCSTQEFVEFLMVLDDVTFEEARSNMFRMIRDGELMVTPAYNLKPL